MRSLTEAEGRVIAVLLGSGPARERERLRRAQIARSTYHAARRRAYEEGWIRDRYVPDPVRLGRPWVSFVLIRPFADHAGELSDAWARDPSNVLTWLSPQLGLGVFFHRERTDGDRLTKQLEKEQWAGHYTKLTAHATEAEIPVYFDYEGLWVHLTEVEGTAEYPIGLGGHFPGLDGPEKPLSDHYRWAVTELIRRPFRAPDDGTGGHLVGPLGLPFSQQRVLRDGSVTHRTIIDPSKVPPYRGRTADQLVFVTGALRAGARPEALFATLTRDCRVFPFLYATDQKRLLIGALGGSPGAEPVRPGAAPSSERRGAMAAIQEYLEGVDVARETCSEFRTIVDHRYDRLVA